MILLKHLEMHFYRSRIMDLQTICLFQVSINFLDGMADANLVDVEFATIRSRYAIDDKKSSRINSRKYLQFFRTDRSNSNIQNSYKNDEAWMKNRWKLKHLIETTNHTKKHDEILLLSNTFWGIDLQRVFTSTLLLIVVLSPFFSYLQTYFSTWI